jgi:23S rRNA pseudouridine1911/1915/1917 synthase
VILTFSVPAALEGERVDRGLALLTGLTRSQAARLVALGQAVLGGRPVKSGGQRLRSGDVLEVALLGTEAAAPTEPVVGAGPTVPEGPLARVVFADDCVVVVDKPAGLVVHPGAGNRTGTLVQQLVSLFPDIASAGPPGDRPGIVHRLDKGTSGLLVVARTPAARENLVAQLGDRSVDRVYLAVVHGELEADEGLVDAPVGRSPVRRTNMGVVQGGRLARTRYRVLARSSRPLEVSLLSCRLETGRTHQARVHLAAIGHPLLADERYASGGQLRAARALLPALRRPWLHAAELGFCHPADERRITFGSPLPADLERTLGLLGLPLPELLGPLLCG